MYKNENLVKLGKNLISEDGENQDFDAREQFVYYENLILVGNNEEVVNGIHQLYIFLTDGYEFYHEINDSSKFYDILSFYLDDYGVEHEIIVITDSLIRKSCEKEFYYSQLMEKFIILYKNGYFCSYLLNIFQYICWVSSDAAAMISCSELYDAIEAKFDENSYDYMLFMKSFLRQCASIERCYVYSAIRYIMKGVDISHEPDIIIVSLQGLLYPITESDNYIAAICHESNITNLIDVAIHAFSHIDGVNISIVDTVLKIFHKITLSAEEIVIESFVSSNPVPLLISLCDSSHEPIVESSLVVILNITANELIPPNTLIDHGIVQILNSYICNGNFSIKKVAVFCLLNLANNSSLNDISLILTEDSLQYIPDIIKSLNQANLLNYLNHIGILIRKLKMFYPSHPYASLLLNEDLYEVLCHEVNSCSKDLSETCAKLLNMYE